MPQVYVGNLSFAVSPDELALHFEQAGRVVNVKIVYNELGRSKGFAFIDFATDEDAERSIALLHDKFYKGRRLKVAPATPKKSGQESHDKKPT